MINRYLGNKTALLDQILRAIRRNARPGDLVCDAFSGSVAVSIGLKRAGFRVAANDINLFSAILGRAFVESNEIPEVPLDQLIGQQGADTAQETAELMVREAVGLPGYGYLTDPAHQTATTRLATLLAHLQGSCASKTLDPLFMRSDFFDNYCERGSQSAFKSSRGRVGRRRFFSEANARTIDSILNQLRQWRFEELISPELEVTLLSTLLGAVERVSNTQGTYHDFPRGHYDPRSLKPLRMLLPPLDGLIGGREKHLIGEEVDSLDFVSTLPSHAVLYLDPPYNFRQYTAYYFLLNVICRYPSLPDPEAYFRNLEYVRGQNPDDNFVSSFCKAKEFIPSLERLIANADVQTVLMSYFNGRNHWNNSSASSDLGFKELRRFFNGPLFVSDSLNVEPIDRLNYQSYGGHKARKVREYLFTATKADQAVQAVAAQGLAASSAGALPSA